MTLLWRGSRDGFGLSTFHKLCDGKGKTLTVVKTTSGYIIGGYTSVPWSTVGAYIPDSTAFLFTLVNPNNTPLKLPVLPLSLQSATYHNSVYGPTFGWGHDLYIADSCNLNAKSFAWSLSYTLPNGLAGSAGGDWMLGSSYFQVSEIEVFLVG